MTTTTLAEPRVRARWNIATMAGLFIVATLAFTAAFTEVLYWPGTSDLTTHIAYAAYLHSLSDLISPHFLFQLLVNGAYSLGLSREMAAVWLLGSCYGGMAVLIGREITRRGVMLSPLHMVVLVMAVLLASHVFLFTMFRPNLYNGYFVPTAYHNPTQQLNKLFALWIYFIYHRQFLSAQPASLSSIPVLGGLCVASAVAKPSFLIAFLPAAALYAALDLLRRRWRPALMCLAAIGIPSALVMLWQILLSRGWGGAAQLAFEPFVVFDAGETLYKLPASIAFPLIVAAGAWWTRTSDSGLRFIWVLTAVALFVTLGVVEDDHRKMHGNFAWTGQTAVFLVYVESLLFLLTQPRRGWQRAAWIAFGFHVVCGLMWYGVTFRTDWETWL